MRRLKVLLLKLGLYVVGSGEPSWHFSMSNMARFPFMKDH